jgi:glycosyltransferase involved in cell wall biosynthesis
VKLAFGNHLRDGPWGGGNRFGRAFVEGLRAEGATVVDRLDDPDVDIILMTDPRNGSQGATFQDRDIARYLFFLNPRAIVVHRVNECDERKATTGINQRLMDANLMVDHTVFVSAWLRDLFVGRGLPSPSLSVIHNGADRHVFHPRGGPIWDGKEPLRLVSHHWGGNWNKGFDVYQHLDRLMAREPWQKRIHFTYIGNLPQGFKFENANYVDPLDGEDLGKELRRHHVYVTASRNEPGSMHNLEGACCGLPLLYLNSGGLTEYCNGYGVMFSETEFEAGLETMLATYRTWLEKIKSFPFDMDKTVAGYIDLMRTLLQRREEIIACRRPSRWVRWLAVRALR